MLGIPTFVPVAVFLYFDDDIYNSNSFMGLIFKIIIYEPIVYLTVYLFNI